MRARKVFLIVILALSFQSVFAQTKNSDIRMPADVMNARILLMGEKALVRLVDLGEKRLVFFLIESWCAPCILQADYLNDLYPSLKESGIEVLGVSSENSAKEKRDLRYMARRQKYKFKLGWIDPRVYKSLFSLSKFAAIPQVYLVTGDKLHGIFLGGSPKVNAEMKKTIDDIWINKSIK